MFFEEEGHHIEICSDMFLDDCAQMEFKYSFNKMAYQKVVRIGDRKFHELFKADTLTIKTGLSGKALRFIPLIK